VKRVTQQWESSPEGLDCPHLYFHFGGTPVQVVVGGGFRLSRQRQEAREAVDPGESARLREFLQRWLPAAPPVAQPELFVSELTEDGRWLLGRHSFREDLVVLAGMGDLGPQLAPGLAPLAVSVAQGAVADPFPLVVKPAERAESSSPGGRSPSP
jgi:hypothetical protein